MQMSTDYQERPRRFKTNILIWLDSCVCTHGFPLCDMSEIRLDMYAGASTGYLGPRAWLFTCTQNDVGDKQPCMKLSMLRTETLAQMHTNVLHPLAMHTHTHTHTHARTCTHTQQATSNIIHACNSRSPYCNVS